VDSDNFLKYKLVH